VNRKNPINRFNLDDQLVLGHHIHSVAAIEADILIDDREWHLTPVEDTGLIKFKT
jgi:hypothetical protein